jgi:hypothetical protein
MGYAAFSDDFEGGNGPLDPYKWDVRKVDATSNASVLEGAMRLHVRGWDRVTVRPLFTMTTHPCTISFKWMQEADAGHTLEFQVLSSDDGEDWYSEEWYYYEAPTGTWYSGNPTKVPTYRSKISTQAAEVGVWYDVQLVVEATRVKFSVTEPGKEDPLVDKDWYSITGPHTTVEVAAWAEEHTITAARIDDFGFYSNVAPVKPPIVVDEIPPIPVVEDLVTRIDLAPYVHDPDDDDISDISVNTMDLHVIDIDGFEVLVTCWEEGGTVEVRLTFTEGNRSTTAFLDLVVEGINDPPRITLFEPLDGQTLYDIDQLRIEFQVTDPDSERWDAEWYVQSLSADYDWSGKAVLGSSRSYTGIAPNIVPGSYLIGISVTDGWDNETVQAWVYVESTETTPAQTTDTGFIATCFGLLFIGVVAIGVIFTFLVKDRRKRYDQVQLDAMRLNRMAKKQRTQRRAPPARAAAPPREVMASAPPKAQPSTAPAYATPRAEPIVPFPTPGPAQEPGSIHLVPTADWRVGSVEEFIDLIPDLPEGFPEPLWGIPQEKVAEEVVATSTIGPRGTPVCRVGGKTFHADKRDLDTFLQPFDG